MTRKKHRANKRKAGWRYDLAKWVVDVLLRGEYHLKRKPTKKESVK